MPPKKKEQEIDVSTLPHWTSKNAIILCSGLKSRSHTILDALKKNSNKYVKYITKSEVIDHAKQKGFYVDPTTLNQKQKKDAKYMSQIITELTPQVLGKAANSLINTHNIKYRIEKKNKLEGKDEIPKEDDKKGSKKQAKKQQKKQEIKPVVEQKIYNKNFDSIYIFQNYPIQQNQFIELAKHQQNIAYIINIKPTITWQSAPQIQQQEVEQEDQEIIHFKKLKAKQVPTADDTHFQEEINKSIKNIINNRKNSPVNSQFRNTLIKDVLVEIDPYTQNQSIKSIPQFIFQTICELSIQRTNYEEWLKTKHTKQLMNSPLKQQQKKKPKQPVTQTTSTTTLGLLLNLVKGIEKSKNVNTSNESKKNQSLKQIENIFNRKKISKQDVVKQGNNKALYINENDQISLNSNNPIKQKSIIQNALFPGINRFKMPEQPQKNEKVRNLEKGQFINFLRSAQDFDQFQRRKKLITFQKYIKTYDEFRNYDFGDRIYQQHHDKQSLINTLYQAMANQPQIITKYNEKQDSLYLIMSYKNPPGKILRKKWSSEWRVLPNFENWMQFFKNNEQNLKNNQFYNIDYEKLGNINQKTKFIYPDDGGMIVIKKRQIAGSQTSSFKIIKDKFTCGFSKSNKFWYTYGPNRINVKQNNNQLQTIVTLKDGLTLILYPNGEVYQHRHNETGRLTLPSGHTIIYNNSQPINILHPNGGISKPTIGYTNPNGYSVENNQMKIIPTLQRTTKQHKVIKRDDKTIIIQKKNTKWIQFFQKTRFQKINNSIIIQKQGFATQYFNEVGFQLHRDDIIIKSIKSQGSYQYSIIFPDSTNVRVQKKNIYCVAGSTISEKNYQDIKQIKNGVYNFSFDKKQVFVANGNSIITVDNQGNSQISDLPNRPSSPDYLQGETIQQASKLLPISEHFIEPRLFIINNTNTGTQFLNQTQLQQYFRIKQSDEFSKINSIKGKNCEVIRIQSKIKSDNQKNKKVIIPDYPQNLDILSIQPQEQVVNNMQTTTVRILQKYKLFTQVHRNQFDQILKNHEQWKNEQIKLNNEFGYQQLPKNILQKQLKLNQNIIRKRREPQLGSPYESTRTKFINELQNKRLDEQKNKQTKKRQSYQKIISNQKTKQIIKKPIKLQKQNKNKSKSNVFVGFCNNYFQTEQGQQILKTMPEWIFKPKHKKQSSQVAIEQLNNNKKSSQNVPVHQQQEKIQNNSIPIQQSVQNLVQTQIIIKPSVFTQQDIDEEKRAFQEQKKAFQYREVKRKQFDVYGRQRVQKPIVPSLLRTQPISELNQKYILTQSVTDKKVKISSMKNRLVMKAPNLAQIRNEGLHQTMMKSIDQAHTFEQLIEKKNLMIHADINDKLRRDILISPIDANFGTVKENSLYQLKIDIKNQDVLVQRIVVKRPKTNYVKAYLNQMGPIPLGITKKVIVQLRTTPDIRGKFTDEFEIVSKHEIYKIPVIAIIVSQESYQKIPVQQQKKSIKSKVSEIIQVAKVNRTSNSDLLPKLQK